MARHASSMHGKECNDNAYKDNDLMVWNVREMHVWAKISGQGIIWQGTFGKCI
jgi:hypothetical protein